MGYWLLKISEQKRYADQYGIKYVYDNTHSVQVEADDEFIYLDKRGGYKLTGAGRIKKIEDRAPTESEKRTDRVKTIFTANFTDFMEFNPPLDLSNSKVGKENRKRLGLPEKLLSWGISMIKLTLDQYTRFVQMAIRNSTISPIDPNSSKQGEWLIEDSYSIVRTRAKLESFRKFVLERHNYQCLICGTTFKQSLEAAHIRGYAEDPENRANPANGICMCKYCHAAFDSGEIVLYPSGELKTRQEITDKVAKIHFTRISKEIRKSWLNGVNLQFLQEKIDELE